MNTAHSIASFRSSVMLTSLRSASRSLLSCSRTHSASAVVRQTRYFSQSRRCQATENQNSFLTNYQNTPLFRQLADKPEALKALNDFAKMLQEQGRYPPDFRHIVCLLDAQESTSLALLGLHKLKYSGWLLARNSGRVLR